MRKKKILQVVEGKVITPEQAKPEKEIQIRRKDYETMRQREWDHNGLDSSSLQHFKSL